VPELTVYGKAYDTPILGFGVDHANLLRLWTSEARESFNFQAFTPATTTAPSARG